MARKRGSILAEMCYFSAVRIHPITFITTILHTPTARGLLDNSPRKRVRKLALDKTGVYLLPETAWNDLQLGTLSNCLRVLPNIDEPLIVEWTPDNIRIWDDYLPDPPQNWWTRRPPGKGKVGAARNLWQCLTVEEIDGMLALYKAIDEEGDAKLESIRENGTLLRDFRQENGPSSRLYRDLQHRLEERLLDYMVRMGDVGGEDTAAPYKIPQIKTVHILPPEMVQYLLVKQNFLWKDLLGLKRGLPDTFSGPIFGRERWWAKDGTIPPPGCDNFYGEPYYFRVGDSGVTRWY